MMKNYKNEAVNAGINVAKIFFLGIFAVVGLIGWALFIGAMQDNKLVIKYNLSSNEDTQKIEKTVLKTIANKYDKDIIVLEKKSIYLKKKLVEEK